MPSIDLTGKVAVVTGSGRGLGLAYAHALAAHGASVVVNDVDEAVAEAAVKSITEAGGTAVAEVVAVGTTEAAERLVNRAVEEFGRLDILVTNAGILRDRVLWKMTDDDFDAVITTHLKGTFTCARAAAVRMREQGEGGTLILVGSPAGQRGNFGQTNYSAAKAGIAAFGMVTAMELGRYGVRSNVIAPLARTRLTLQTPGMDQMIATPEDPGKFDAWDAANVSPLVAYLATADCPFNGGVFHVGGGEIGLFQNWTMGAKIAIDERWTVEGLEAEAKKLLEGRPALASTGTPVAELTADFTSRYMS